MGIPFEPVQVTSRDYWLSAGFRGTIFKKVRLGSECDMRGLCDFMNLFLPTHRLIEINISESEPMEATDGPAQSG